MAAERRTAFGEVAELYDRARPSYPTELVEETIAVAPFEQFRPGALEVGAGTGKATVLFARRGISVHALEPSRQMAAIAERNCAEYPDVVVERVEFERFVPPTRGYPLLYSAQAWHWVLPATRYRNARAALVRGGVLATFWNRPDWERNPLRERIDDAYRSIVQELLPSGVMRPGSSPDVWNRWIEEIDRADGFERPEIRSYRWDTDYSGEEYVRLLRTHSDHIVLDRAPRERLYTAIEAAIDDHGGVLPLSYVTRLCLARAR
jgi:SAM-dependent methyltransferase